MIGEWGEGEVAIWGYLGAFAVSFLVLPAILYRIMGVNPIISWILAFGIIIFAASMLAELGNKSLTALDEIADKAFGRLAMFGAGWIWWWVCIVALITTVWSLAIYIGAPASAPFLGIFLMLILGYYKYHSHPHVHKIMFWMHILLLFSLGLFVLGSVQTFSFTSFIGDYDYEGILLCAFFALAGAVILFISGFVASRTSDPAHATKRSLLTVIGFAGISFVSLLIIYASHPAELVGDDLFIGLASHKMLSSSMPAIVIVSIISLSAALIWLWLGTEIVYRLSQESLMFRKLGVLHPQYRTMGPALEFHIILTGVLMVLTPAAADSVFILLGVLALLCSILLQILFVCYGVLKYRDRKFQNEHYINIVLAGLAAIFIAYLQWVFFTLSSIGISVARVAFGIILGAIVFFFLMELYYNHRAQKRLSDISAYAMWVFESLLLPKRIRKVALSHLGILGGKKVLELGCGVGTLTLDIANAVGGTKVYATDMSEKDLIIARRRIIRKGFYNVRFIHDPNHLKRLHPKVPNVDAVVSVGLIGSFDNPMQVLKVVNEKLHLKDPICFIEYDKYFDVIPNQDWLRHDSAIQRTFNKAGFKVQVERKQGFAWRYVIIHGKKVKTL